MKMSLRFVIFQILILLLLIGAVSAQVLDVPDPNLASALRETLSLSTGEPLTVQHLERLTRFPAWERNIVSLTGLEYAINLETTSLWGNRISNLTPLANLTKLRYLDLAANGVLSDITPLANL